MNYNNIQINLNVSVEQLLEFTKSIKNDKNVDVINQKIKKMQQVIKDIRAMIGTNSESQLLNAVKHENLVLLDGELSKVEAKRLMQANAQIV